MGSAFEALKAAFGSAAPAHFEWQTEAAYVADRERELIQTAFMPLGERLLDLGCGEGATLVHLGRTENATGVDLFEEKLQFARTRLPKCHFVAASACDLPFDTHSFDHILVRDVIHHIEEVDKFVDECYRVLSPKGKLDILEPCRYNPLIFMHALAKPEERGELRSTPAFLRRIVGRKFRVDNIEALQAMPIHRILFHPDMGKPQLATIEPVRAAVSGLERMAERLVPKWAWAYIHLRATVS